MRRANSKQSTTAICLLETALRTLDGRYLGHRDGAGEVQNDEVEENELAEDDREVSLDGKENLEIEVVEGVASSLGDLSTNGSLPGVLKSFRAVRSNKPMSAVLQSLVKTRLQLSERLYVVDAACKLERAGLAFEAARVEGIVQHCDLSPSWQSSSHCCHFGMSRSVVQSRLEALARHWHR